MSTTSFDPDGGLPAKSVNGADDGDVVNGANGANGEALNRLPEDAAQRKYCKDVFVFANQKAAVQDAKQHADRHPKALSAVITQTSKLWTRGTQGIWYGWASSYGGTDPQRGKVRLAIQEWERYGEIHFYEASPNSSPPAPIPDIIVAFDPSPSEGSWSLVGTDSSAHAGKGETTMNLGWLDPNSDLPTESEKAVILHEFGHALGMLHEHQSPAGGGVKLEYEAAAIKYYGDSQGWSESDVRKQVIETYNLQDVSSFSQVDHLSIMQYPMPARVTGLPYDIDYNYTLSDMDKAYMSIMYPRVTPHESGQEWTLEHALTQAGIAREDPVTAQKIRDLATPTRPDGTIDPTQIRKLFSNWAVKAHVAPDVPLHGPQPPPKPRSDRVIKAYPHSMCASAELTTSTSRPDGAASAVIDAVWLKHLFNFTTVDNHKDYVRRITWSISPCPKSSAEPTVLISATAYQTSLVEQALKGWSALTAVEFVPAGENEQANIIFVFQKYHWGKPNYEITTMDFLHRSYTYPVAAIPKLVPYDDKSSDRSMLFDSGRPQVKHTICYRGIAETKEDGEKSSTMVFQNGDKEHDVTVAEFNLRTIKHEIGHYLGLDHQDVGIYGYALFTDSLTVTGLLQAKRFISTKFDTGSIMDSFALPDALKELQGLGPKDNRSLLRSVFDFSTFDKANIALLHPGKGLDADKIEACTKALHLDQVDDTSVDKLKKLGKEYDWLNFRATYLDLLKKQEELWSDIKEKLDAEIQKYARNNGGSILAEPGSLRGFGASPVLRAPTVPAPGNPAKVESPPLLETLYKKLSETVGPNGGQILTLQFPTRYLAKEEFQYELSGIYSNFVKPVVVSEAEFRLTDALYDPSPIVGASNGKSLSTVYHQVINNFVPKYDEADKLARQERERIRSWLLTEVGDSYYKFDYNTSGGGLGDDGKILARLNSTLPQNNNMVRKMSRMEFSSQLTQEYFDAQKKWELERDEMIAKAIDSKDPVELAKATRKLVHISQSEQGKLAMKNADAVVRGYSHIVREALGHLDVATPAEILQDAKDAFRTSAVSSLYGASKVYPVLMSPVDWSAALDTGFAAEDLSENPDMIIMAIKTKAGAMDIQKRQLSLLQSSVSGDPEALRAEVEKKAKELNQAESALQGQWAESTLQLAKIVIAVASKDPSGSTGIQDAGVLEDVVGAKKAEDQAREDLDKEVKKIDPNKTAEDVIKQIQGVGDAQRNLQHATSAWNSTRAALARAEATETKAQRIALESSIDALSVELVDLNARLVVARSARERAVALAKKKTLVVDDLAANKPTATGGGSRWQEINIVHHQEYTEETTDVKSAASSESWGVNFWIASGGGSSETSSSSFDAANNAKKIDLEISMKVTVVTVDRSSWFQPHLFENSKGYMKNTASMKFTNWAPGTSPETLANTFRTTDQPAKLATGTLPCYPVGYILCKDVSIKVSGMALATSTSKTHLLEKSQSSGGCLFFSYSRASESQHDTSRATFQVASDGLMIRIPGPQILGYVQQIVPADESTPYDPKQSLGKEFYLPPGVTKDSGGSHSVRPDSAPAQEDPVARFIMDTGKEEKKDAAAGPAPPGKSHGVAAPGGASGGAAPPVNGVDDEAEDPVTRQARQLVNAILKDTKLADAVRASLSKLG